MPRTVPLDKQKDSLRKMFAHAMAEKDWNQKHLAKICGMTESQISLILKNPEKHRFTSIIVVARKLGISEIPIVR